MGPANAFPTTSQSSRRLSASSSSTTSSSSSASFSTRKLTPTQSTTTSTTMSSSSRRLSPQNQHYFRTTTTAASPLFLMSSSPNNNSMSTPLSSASSTTSTRRRRHFFRRSPLKAPQQLRIRPTTYSPQKQQQQQQQLHASKSDHGLSSTPPSFSMAATAASTLSLVGLDIIFRFILSKLGISFPPSLVGCFVLFVTMVLFPPAATVFQPGAALFAKWLPVLFCPILITLPLVDGVGGTTEILKLMTIIVGGYFFTLLTTAGSVLLVRKLLPSSSPAAATVIENKDEDAQSKFSDEELNMTTLPSPATTSSSSPRRSTMSSSSKQPTTTTTTTTQSPPPFSKDFIVNLRNTVGATLLCASVAANVLVPHKSKTSTVVFALDSAFMFLVTLHNYALGSRLPQQWNNIVHPLVTCTSLTWMGASILAMTRGSTFAGILQTYRTGTLPFRGMFGAGDLLLYLLGPMIISLSVSMYGRRKLMQDNLKEVGTAVTVASFGSLFMTGLAARALKIAPIYRLSMVSRIVTPSLAIVIAEILKCHVSIAVTAVVLTGLLGASFGRPLLDKLGIQDPIIRGLSMGTSGHGLGTGAMVKEPDAFPFSAMAMALVAFCSTIIVSIPFFQTLLLKLTLGR